MSLLSESQLRGIRNRARFSYGTINESLREYKNESKFNKTTIFLSHKHDELEVLDGVITLLKSHGVDIYIDWLDSEIIGATSGKTAKRIKEKIRKSNKFVFIATEGAILSKWCNWELGLGDAAKYIKDIAIIPVKKDNVEFSGAEYLQIYPYIEYHDGSGENQFSEYYQKGYYVRYPKILNISFIEPLSEWLKR